MAARDEVQMEHQEKRRIPSVTAREEVQMERTHTVDEPFTTIMLGNIPFWLKSHQLRTVVNMKGFEGKYDYLYIPCTSGRRSNLGYGFINLVGPEDARQFMLAIDKFCFSMFSPTEKLCSVQRASLQGREANLNRLGRKSRAESSIPLELLK